MAVTTEEFVTGFHSLTGITIGERRKNLFLLLNGIDKTKSDALNFSQLIPKTPLQEKFKLEVLIYFKRIHALLEVLKSENPILIKRVLKVSWFLKEAFQNITGEDLVTRIFPYISYNAKQKLLNKLPLYLKTPQQADACFEAVEKKYGFYLASKLLPACSSEIILNYMKLIFTLTPRQLLVIIKRNPEMMETILKKITISRKRVDVNRMYRKIFIYLAQHDVELFFKYNLGGRLGWRNTDKYIQLNREDVIANPNKYYQLLHKKEIAKSLNEDFRIFYRNMFPESLDQLQSNAEVFTMLHNRHRNMGNVNLLFTTFKEVYGSQLWDHAEYREINFLKMLPPNERELITNLDSNKPYYMTEEKWYSYMKTEKSIPYLKKKISLTSDVKIRSHLIRLLVKTCYLNGDKKALLDTCNYMLIRHRNDNVSVRESFAIKLRQTFYLPNLSEEYWTVINDLLQLFTLNNESFSYANDFYEDYIHFRLKNDLPIKENLIVLLQKYPDSSLNIIRSVPKYEKKCLLMFGELIPELFIKNEEKFERYAERITSCIISWNQKHREDPIEIFSYCLNQINYRIDKGQYWYWLDSMLKYFLKFKTGEEITNKMLKFYLKKPSGSNNLRIITWLVRNQPLLVIDNIRDVTRNPLESSWPRTDPAFLWKFWRNYSHLENFQEMKTISLSKLTNFSDSSDASIAVKGLSYLLPGIEFNKIITPYYPSGSRAESGKNKTMCEIQRYIGPCLKNLTPSGLTLDIILSLYKEGYFKLIQRSLYSVCGNVNEDKLIPFFYELSGQAISVRKQAVHLGFRTLSKEQIYNVLNKFMETEKNASVRKFLFKDIFNFFILNPDDSSWNLLILNVKETDINDKKAMKILMQKEKIPARYKIRYIQFMWDILHKLPDGDKGKEYHISSLLNSDMSDMIKSLPEEFCNGIIEKYFFKTEDASLTALQLAVHKFTCLFIISCDFQEECLKTNFETIKKFVLEMKFKNYLRCTVKKYVGNFLKEFCAKFISKDCQDVELFIKFANLWNDLFKPHQAFDEYLHLEFTLICIQKPTLREISEKLAKLLDSLGTIYGFSIVNEFSRKIKSFDDNFLICAGKSLKKYWSDVIENLISTEKSIYCLVLAVLLLNDHKPKLRNTDIKYRAIIENLEKNFDPTLQLYIANHLAGSSNDMT